MIAPRFFTNLRHYLRQKLPLTPAHFFATLDQAICKRLPDNAINLTTGKNYAAKI
jgi:hypothetical protein